MFLIIAITCVVTGIAFQIFGAATVQPWAIPHYQAKLNASTFTVHMSSQLSLNGAPTMTTLQHSDDEDPDATPRTSLLGVPHRVPRRSPRVSIMEEDNGEIVYPGDEPTPVLKKISE